MVSVYLNLLEVRTGDPGTIHSALVSAFKLFSMYSQAQPSTIHESTKIKMGESQTHHN